MNRSSKPGSVWVLNLGRVVGIPIRVHLTFFLLLAVVVLDALDAKVSPSIEVLFVLAVFGSVLLHELGHAITAKFFGLKTRDIVLYPFGGIASLMGDATPGGELLIASAGPLVNLIIAALLSPFVIFNPEILNHVGSNLITRIFFANITLAVFNLIPALPMDGGRVLRSFLMLIGVRRATLFSIRLSQIISVLMGLVGIYAWNPILIMVSVVVFSFALQEQFQDRAKSVGEGQTASDVMIDAEHLSVFNHGATLSSALTIALKSLQNFFPVVYGGEVLGIVEKESLIRASAIYGEENYIAEVMIRDFIKVSPTEPLISCLGKLDSSGGLPLVVMKDGQFAGLLMKERVIEYLLVNDLKRHAPPPIEASDDFV